MTNAHQPRPQTSFVGDCCGLIASLTSSCYPAHKVPKKQIHLSNHISIGKEKLPLNHVIIIIL